MSFLHKIKDDLENDLLTSTYQFLGNKLKKIIYEESDPDVVVFQRFFGSNIYNVDLSKIYLIDDKSSKKLLTYYLFQDNIINITFRSRLHLKLYKQK